jgi:glutathione-regulated potassium-efflux system protein KefB
MGAAVIAVPLFRRLGLGSVLGYFGAGVLLGPSLFGLFTDTQSILHFSELGVVMFLFVIGLELRPHKLWAMGGQIFGLGLAQVGAAIAALSLTGALVFGLSGPVAFIAGTGFVLSSTAVIMSMLQDRGELSSPEGQKSVAILLFEDLMIVPLLALVAFLSPLSDGQSGWMDILIAGAAMLALPFRANVPLAAGMTFLSNPATTPFILAASYYVGSAMLGRSGDMSQVMALIHNHAGLSEWTAWLLSETAPALIFGLAIVSVVTAAVGYLLAVWLWRGRMARKWTSRRHDRAKVRDAAAEAELNLGGQAS